jgi:hypothetical protein
LFFEYYLDFNKITLRKLIMRKITWVMFLLALGVISCQPESADEKAVKTLSEGEWDEVTRIMYKEDGTIDSSKLAIFEWEEGAEYDFGSVVDGEKVEYKYKFKNVGAVPLIIKEATGSCGCTVAEYPEEPIAPGQSREIKVKFNSTGRVGNARKQVTLKANTLPQQTKLTLTGIVKAGDKVATDKQ